MLTMEHTLKFLTNLTQNNDQGWFLDHLGEYEQARTQVTDFAYLVFQQLLFLDTQLDEDVDVGRFISNLVIEKPKKGVPYRTYFSVTMSPLANEGNEPQYHIHIDPLGSFLSMRYDPDVFGLQVIRNFIFKNLNEFHLILDDAFSSGFALNQVGALTAVPKGYLAGTAAEPYLKLRRFELISPLDWSKSPEELLTDIVMSFRQGIPFLQFLRRGLGFD